MVAFILSPPLRLLLLLSLPLLPAAQQIGSFFTAINYANAPLPAGHSACDNMGSGAGGYCCQPSQACAWDDGGNVACCASGSTCQGSAYQGGSGGAKYDQSQQQQGQWQQQQQAGGGCNNNNCGGGGGGGGCNNCGGGGGGGCNNCACNTCGHDTTTVYQAQSSWQPSPTSQYIAPAAVVPVSQTSTYVQLSSVPTTANNVPATPVVAGGGVKVTTVVPVDQACGGGGYTTLTQANVGAPVRTVGCYVIFEAAGSKKGVERWVWSVVLGWMGWWWLLMMRGR